MEKYCLLKLISHSVSLCWKEWLVSNENQQTTTHLFVEKSYLSKRQEGAARVGAIKATSSIVMLANADEVEPALSVLDDFPSIRGSTCGNDCTAVMMP